MSALRAARVEMARITARVRVGTALRCNLPAAMYRMLRVGGTVLWYWDKPLPRWTRPYAVTSVSGAIARIDNGDRQTFASVYRLKVYHEKIFLERDSGHATTATGGDGTDERIGEVNAELGDATSGQRTDYITVPAVSGGQMRLGRP